MEIISPRYSIPYSQIDTFQGVWFFTTDLSKNYVIKGLKDISTNTEGYESFLLKKYTKSDTDLNQPYITGVTSSKGELFQLM